jgi:hypothetical protein
MVIKCCSNEWGLSIITNKLFMSLLMAVKGLSLIIVIGGFGYWPFKVKAFNTI